MFSIKLMEAIQIAQINLCLIILPLIFKINPKSFRIPADSNTIKMKQNLKNMKKYHQTLREMNLNMPEITNCQKMPHFKS